MKILGAANGRPWWKRGAAIALWLCALCVIGLPEICPAIESGRFRLLSISNTSKLILVSQIPNKTKYLLDASAAKVTVDGKPAEYGTIRSYSVIRAKFELRKFTRDGVEIDGTVTEINVVGEDNPK